MQRDLSRIFIAPKTYCPGCRREISPRQIETSTDFAHCSHCNLDFTVVDLLRPPAGANFVVFNNGFEISMRNSIPGPAPLMDIIVTAIFIAGWVFFGLKAQEHAARLMNPAMKFIGFMFLAIALSLASNIVWKFCGRLTLRVDGDTGKLKTSFGLLNWEKSFDWASVTEISQKHRGRIRPGRRRRPFEIVMIGQTKIVFGYDVTPKQQYFVVSAVTEMLRKRDLGQPYTEASRYQ